MDRRAEKLALARKKLKNHQEKKSINILSEEISDITLQPEQEYVNDKTKVVSDINTANDADSHIVKSAEDCNVNVNNALQYSNTSEANLNVAEFLISNKTKLEKQVNELQDNLLQAEHNYTTAVENDRISKDIINNLQNMLKNVQENNLAMVEQNRTQEKNIDELQAIKSSLFEEKCNLMEQLEFTKTLLSDKEIENTYLRDQMSKLQNQLDVMHLKLEQLTNGTSENLIVDKKHNLENHNDELIQKISNLEQQLKFMQKERDQTNAHYEHYVHELNEQLGIVLKKNDNLTKELHSQSQRENSLIDQISEMEKRLQNYLSIKMDQQPSDISNGNDLQKDYVDSQDKLKALALKYNELETRYTECQIALEELREASKLKSEHGNICLSKLNEDITSDKVALQRALEQNKKLKLDLQCLEEDFVKMSQEKLEFTEKLSAEKYLNRELTIKLAEAEQGAKEMLTKLRAKDEEMIRLQADCRELEKRSELMVQAGAQARAPSQPQSDAAFEEEAGTRAPCPLDQNEKEMIPKEDAMLKLQERFYKIMDEVASLSDEKHRLEHIILQLQNETETICEYVALYQQQRSLLRRREEERSAQVKTFQVECAKLRTQLDQLTDILGMFLKDKHLTDYFGVESRRIEMQKVMELLSNLKTNSVINPELLSDSELSHLYPCNCCSGRLIDV